MDGVRATNAAGSGRNKTQSRRSAVIFQGPGRQAAAGGAREGRSRAGGLAGRLAGPEGAGAAGLTPPGGSFGRSL